MVKQSPGKVRLHHICLTALFAVLVIFVISSGELHAQIGLQAPPPNINVASPDAKSSIPLGIGLGITDTLLYPQRDLFTVRTVTFDSLTNSYVIRRQINNVDIYVPNIIPRDRFIEEGRYTGLRKRWSEATLRSVSGTSTAQGSQGMNITIPVPIQSKAFSRLVGSNDISLSVTGEVDIKGNLVKNDYAQVKDVNMGSDYSFKLEQTQRFHITGKVGEKISVLVDQDSERDFDLENNIRLFYTGDEDEIFKSIEAGNVSLALPGTQFISFSGVNKGLFGFKMVNQIGKLNMTSIASLERGQKQSVKITGGTQATTKQIRDFDYLEGTYFFVDQYYQENYEFDSGSRLPRINSQRSIVEIEVWLAQPGDALKSDAEQAWAVSDPENFVPSDDIALSADTTRQYFRRLEANVDYILRKDEGYIIMNRPVRNTEFLAVGFKDASDREVGHLFPPHFATGDTTNAEPFVLKLIRTNNPRKSDAGWYLEWRNVYSMGNEGVNKDGFDMKIVNNRDPQRSPLAPSGVTYLEIFGFDRTDPTGTPNSDNKVDLSPVLFDFSRGHIIFPGTRPFDPEHDPFDTTVPTLLPQNMRVPTIYDTVFVNPTEKSGNSWFDIEVSFSGQSSTFSLNVFNVIEGSEEVYLNGQPLARSVDYDIDYSIGQVTIMNQAALAPGQDLEIKFESAEIFQLDKKTMMGTRMQYDFSETSFIGASALFLNESTVERWVQVGQEPIKNLVWGMNARFQEQSTLITSLVDRLPFIEAMAPSSIQFEGEIAQSKPNPNTLNNDATGDPMGVAFVDNFEGSRRLSSLGIMRREWTIGSPATLIDPVLQTPRELDNANRAKMIWYNPFEQVDIKEILPNKDVNLQTKNRVNVLNLQFIRDSKGEFPEDNPWGSVMKAMSPGYFNQTESKFLEFWVKGDTGTIVIDIGLISEDAIDLGTFNSEDLVISSFPNGVLDDGEDVGLDGIAETDGPGSSEPFDDDWRYSSQSIDYSNINGTEGNGSGGQVDGGRVPDTEDLNANGSLDTRRAYYQYTVYLGDNHPVSSEYIVGGQDNEKGWRLYRIPLADHTGTVGDPDFSRIEYARVTVTDMEEDDMISLYTLDLVGNKWIELGFAENDSLMRTGTYTKNDTNIVVGVVNTEENPNYTPPRGVEGFIDPITKAREREQSLELRFLNMAAYNSVGVRQAFMRDQDLLHYHYLKIFVYRDSSQIFADSSAVEFYMQFGRDFANYYEVRQVLEAGWNEIVVDLYQIPTLKTEEYLIEGKPNEGYRLFEVTNEDGTTTFQEWYRRGQPSLSAVRQVVLGVKNNSVFPIQESFVWFNELRVSEVDRTPGLAYRANMNVKLSDLGTVTVNYTNKEANFHTLTEKYGTGNNLTEMSVATTMEASKLISPLKMFSIPVSFNMRTSNGTPKWLTGSDILYDPNLAQAKAEELKSKSTGFSARFSKITKSDNFFIKNTIDAINVNYQHQKSNSQDVNNEFNDSWSNQGSIDYRITTPDLGFSPFKFLGESRFVKSLSAMRFSLLPQGFESSLSAVQSQTRQKLRVRQSLTDTTSAPNDSLSQANVKEVYRFEADRRIATNYAPIPSLQLTFDRSSKHDLHEVKNPAKMFSYLFADSTAIQTLQNVNLNYKPTWLEFLSPQFTYRTGYSLTANRQLIAAGKTASANRTVSTKFTLSAQKLVNIVYKPKEERSSQQTAAQTQARRRVPRRRQALQQEEPEKAEEEKKEEEEKEGGIKINPLHYIEKLSSFIAPVAVSLDRTQSSQIPGLEDTPTLNYQLGFTADPGVSILDNLSQNAGSLSDTEGITLSSRLDLFKLINFTMTYTRSTSEMNQNNTLTGQNMKTVLVFNDKELPLPQFTAQINDLQKLLFLKKVANSIRYNMSYDGKRTEAWKDTPDNLSNNQLDYGFRPLIGLNILWKKGITTTFQMVRSTMLQSLTGGAETKTLNNSMSMTTSFNWSSGFRIPLPFLSRKKIQNNIKFDLTYNQNHNSTMQKRQGTDFEPQNSADNWSVRPQMSYSFSTKVTGSMFFEYRNNSNIKVGNDTSKDFGIQVLIRIAG